MANWKLKELRDERRRTFLKMAGVAAAAVGIERSRLLNFLADEGGYGLAEAAGSPYARSLMIPGPQGAHAWYQELWPMPAMAVRASVGMSTGTSDTSYLYSPGNNFNGMYCGTYTGMKHPNLTGVLGTNTKIKYIPGAGNQQPFFYSPDAPWMNPDGSPKFEVSAYMCGKNETHTGFPVSSTLLPKGSMMAALSALGSVYSTSVIPVIGVNPVKYGDAPGAPGVTTVSSGTALIDLFNSAASKFTLQTQVDQELFDTYFKAFMGLRKAAGRSSWTPTLAVSKGAAQVIGLSYSAALTPTDADKALFGLTELEGNTGPASNLSAKQREHLTNLARTLIVVAKTFELGLSKTAIVGMTPDTNGETTFTDPHLTFTSSTAMQQGRNTTHYLGMALDAFYKYLADKADPEASGTSIANNTVFVGWGDTPHDSRTGASSSWADATAQDCNWMYVMDPRKNVKPGWFGQCYNPPDMVGGLSAVAFSPLTGADVAAPVEPMTQLATTAAVYAVSNGDKNKTASFGVSPNAIPALVKA